MEEIATRLHRQFPKSFPATKRTIADDIAWMLELVDAAFTVGTLGLFISVFMSGVRSGRAPVRICLPERTVQSASAPRGGNAQRVFDLAAGVVAEQQPALTFRSPFSVQVDPHRRKSGHHRPVFPFGYFVGLPVERVLDLEQVLDGAALSFQLRIGPGLFDPGAGPL